LLFIFANPHPEAPTHPSTPKELRTKERIPTPHPSTISPFRFAIESIKEIRGASTYIDNILAYNNFMEEQVEHLQKEFQRLKENKLYAKFEKCEFRVTKMDFFGHRIT
jgi:hypothetical protein